MRRGILLLVLFVSACSVAIAEQVDDQKDLGVTFDLTYTSRWMSKGIDVFREQGGLFASVDLDFYDTGFGFRLTHRNALGGPYAYLQRFDYRPYYKNSLFDDEAYKLNFNLSTGYEHYYRSAPENSPTTWEWIGAFSWPQLIGNGLVPKYVVHYEHPAAESSLTSKNGQGWVHRFILDYTFDLEPIPHPIKFSSELAYYDGLLGRPSVWAYSTFGLTSKFDVNEDLALVPGVYYQITFDDRILRDGKDENVLYAMVSMKYAF